MGSGIVFPLGSIAVAETEAIIISSEYRSPHVTVSSQGAWTPPQYSKPALTILTVPATSNTATGQPSTPTINYVFDAVMRINHSRSLVKTQHPVLTGANISDHAFVKPSVVVLEIGMSDAMSSFSAGVWVGAATKSVSAWQILKQLQISRTSLTLTTRLDTYANMLIKNLTSPDDNKTLHGLRATVTLEEILSGSISSIPNVSARPQTSGSSSGGTIQSVPPNQSQIEQNVIPSTLWPNTPLFPSVPGAGLVSSNSLGQVPTE
jgi:hypothetical protein